MTSVPFFTQPPQSLPVSKPIYKPAYLELVMVYKFPASKKLF